MINFKARNTEFYGKAHDDETVALANEHIMKIKERSSAACPEKYVLGCLLLDFYESKSYASRCHDINIVKECGYNLATNLNASVFFAVCDVEFGLDKSKVSRYMNVVDEFGSDERSEGLYDEYRQYKWSVLEEMLSLDEKQRKYIKPDMTVREVREIKKELVAMSQQNKPKRKKPEKNERFKGFTRKELIEYIDKLEAQIESLQNDPLEKGVVK